MADNKTISQPTISDVAALAGVSISTVSRVINSTVPVASDTAQRVWQAIEQLRYVPRPAAQILAGSKTNTIGLLLPSISGAFFTEMLRGIEAAVRQNGFDLLIYVNQDVSSASKRYPQPLGEHNTDGIIIFTGSLDDSEIARLHQRDFPQVLLHRSPPAGLTIPCVAFENKAGARSLVDHLIEVHGYRRIAYLTGPSENEDSYWRKLGYQASLKTHNLPFNPALVGYGGFNHEEAHAFIEKWLQEGLQADAIFAGNDEAASGVMLALRNAGKRIPEDIAVVGFDDASYARYLTPPLTTIQAPSEKAGLLAAQQLVNLIQTGQAQPFILLPTELKVRQSCGCS
jgi:DNA-binding LacI/PurR family transcriptional regulator